MLTIDLWWKMTISEVEHVRGEFPIAAAAVFVSYFLFGFSMLKCACDRTWQAYLFSISELNAGSCCMMQGKTRTCGKLALQEGGRGWSGGWQWECGVGWGGGTAQEPAGSAPDWKTEKEKEEGRDGASLSCC